MSNRYKYTEKSSLFANIPAPLETLPDELFTYFEAQLQEQEIKIGQLSKYDPQKDILLKKHVKSQVMVNILYNLNRSAAIEKMVINDQLKKYAYEDEKFKELLLALHSRAYRYLMNVFQVIKEL